MKYVGVGAAMLGFAALCAAIAIFCLPLVNDFQTKGKIRLAGLKDRVSVQRDEKGMAYLHARNLEDLLTAQGFATAQDRLFQMQLTRMMIQGRLGEMAGQAARALDIRMRTMGLYAMAKKQAAMLDDESRWFFQSYVNGINAFIAACPDDIPVEFRLASIRPEPWEIVDSIAILYYMGFSTAANLSTEIISQMLLETVGYEKTCQIMPLNLNPDDPGDFGKLPLPPASDLGQTHGAVLALAAYAGDRVLRAGSNNWAVSPALSAGGSAMLAGDPHLDTRILPGVWYPIGLFTPEIRAVGVNIPGIPGMAMGRTSHIALSMTNNYGDMTDLYIETLDPANPDHYLEGSRSLPFEQFSETLKFKDKNAPGGFRTETVIIRKTRRGPVVSHVLGSFKTNQVLTLRFAPAESMETGIGLTKILRAKTCQDLSSALTQCPMICLNWVFADTRGNIGHRASGKIPVRANGDGIFPHRVRNGKDNWLGWIPQDRMPHVLNPPKGWVGTCNQKTVSTDYPWYYSSYFASSFRYRRLKELMAQPHPKSLDHMWAFQRDVLNPMARQAAPVMAEALMEDEAVRDLGQILSQWDFYDKADHAAPAVFQSVYKHFLFSVFEDELGLDKVKILVQSSYFWQERVLEMIRTGTSPWFDDIRTRDRVESLGDMLCQAAFKAKGELTSILGPDPSKWEWGRVHTLELVNPIRRKGPGKTLLGTGPMAMSGSGETLFRAAFAWDKSFQVNYCAALRMVADFSDDDKVAAVIPGGAAARTFHAHQRDQVRPFMDGKKLFWWFSDRAVRAHARTELVLVP